MFFFPFSTLHELNLDWILDRVKTLWSQTEENNQKADYAVQTADEAKEIAEQAAQGQIGDGSVTTSKLANLAVTDAKLAANSVTEPKLSSALAAKINGAYNFSTTANAGRYNNIGARYHVDCVNGDDNNSGESGHPWKTLDKFFSMMNNLTDGRADMRCYLDTPGTYDVGTNAEYGKTFTGVSFHITGGLDSSAPYDGNYIIRFLNTSETKFYCSHANFRNVKIQCPNATSTDVFSFDGSDFSVGNCYLDFELAIYSGMGTITDTTAKSVKISGGNVTLNRVKTLSTTGYQYTVTNGAIVTYAGSINNYNLIANSAYEVFSLASSILNVQQVYPSTLGTNITAINSIIVAEQSRLISWKNKAGTFTNSFWVSDYVEPESTFESGDTYNLTLTIVPVILTAAGKSFHFAFNLPKNITATGATINQLTGAIRTASGGYVSDGSVASASSDWLEGSNIAGSTVVVEQNIVRVNISMTDVPTAGGTNLPNNSIYVYEGSLQLTFT